MCGIWAIFGSEGDPAGQCNLAHKIQHRGPDAFRIETIHGMKGTCLGFHRLAINDDLCGMQPMRIFQHPYIYLMYNGEIYNCKELQKQFGFKYDTNCDGEVIIHLYCEGGIEFAAKHLDGVFGFCLLDTRNRKVFLGRDTFGVKPLFRAKSKSGFLALSSEAKGLVGLNENGVNEEIEVFPPGHVETYKLDSEGRAFFESQECFHTIGDAPYYTTFEVEIDPDDVKSNIQRMLSKSIRKRMMAERLIGCLLSGGLDSSIITALVVKFAREQNLNYKVQTFSIGMVDSPDMKAARKVADYLGTEHHEVIFTEQEGIAVLNDVIYQIESYDITTVRSSVAMYLLSKYIREKTDTTVILTGEGSDEISQGYLCFHKAPSPEEAAGESQRLCQDLHYFDVLRIDRSTSGWGLEVRVPFLDHRFTHYYLSLPNEVKVPQKGIEKYLLRSAFSDSSLLPDDILWRQKEACSDGLASVKKSWFEMLQSFIDTQIADSDVESASSKYSHLKPTTKEALFYRRVFEKHFPGNGKWIPYFWMPRWMKTNDPSARTLNNYNK